MSNDSNELQNELTFEVDASILNQLGEQLVTRRSIALAELIKNAYDADATMVEVLLDKVTAPGGTIIVDDNGTGMTLDAIRQFWMRIATDNKYINPLSPVFDRPRTGRKGIGRFAAHRLASKLSLISVAEEKDGSKQKVTVEFDWGKNFKSGQLLTQIPVKYQTQAVPDDTKTGVTLYLEPARDIWTEEDIAELWKDLVSLVHPFPETLQKPSETSQKDPGFQMKIEAPEFPDYEGELTDQFLAGSWCILWGEVSAGGIASFQLKIRSTGEELDFALDNETFPDIADVNMRVHFFVFRRDFYSNVDFTMRDARRIGGELGGIRVYQDSFRVFPYGEPGNDWLRLNEIRARRTTGFDMMKDMPGFEDVGRPELLTPGNNQLFGVVNVSQTRHKPLAITTSREGFAENDAFHQLQRFVQVGLWWMTLVYARATFEERRQRRVAHQEAKRSSVPDMIRDVKRAVELSVSIPPETREQIVRELSVAETEADLLEDEHIDELSLLRVLSSTGTTVSMVDHQLKEMIAVAAGIITDLKELTPYVDDHVRTRFEDIVYRLVWWRKTIEDQIALLGFLLGEKARKEKSRPVLHVVASHIADSLRRYMDDFGITFSNEIPLNLRTPNMYPAELYAILLHVFTNALKAVREQPISRIAMQGERTGEGIHVYVLDTGKGLSEEEKEKVFRPFHPRTGAPDPILGTGTGLGLKIVRDTLANYNGTVQFTDAEDPWTTCLEIFLPD